MVQPNPSESSLSQSFVVEIPAKAMLFGEYGVLRGGAAVTALLEAHRFRVEFSVARNSSLSECGIEFDSRFFSGPVWVPADNLEDPDSSESESEARKIACYVTGFYSQLRNYKMKVRVLESYSPSLGFGSSSALLVAFQTALARYFGPSQSICRAEPEKLYRALMALQGKGSGYDVAVQSWAAERAGHKRSAVTFFKNTAYAEGRFVPDVREIQIPPAELSQLGCFVQTGVRSETTRVLKSTSAVQNSDEFCALQSACAEQFYARPTAQNAAALCRKSSPESVRMGLLVPTPDVLKFVGACNEYNFAWKTMGAGHGDCLWVIAPAGRVADIIKKIKAESLSISFDFAGKD
jgi:mevalonate kinase